MFKFNQLHRLLPLAMAIAVIFSSNTSAQDLRELMQEGIAATETGDWEDAVESFEAATEEAPAESDTETCLAEEAAVQFSFKPHAIKHTYTCKTWHIAPNICHTRNSFV